MNRLDSRLCRLETNAGSDCLEWLMAVGPGQERSNRALAMQDDFERRGLLLVAFSGQAFEGLTGWQPVSVDDVSDTVLDAAIADLEIRCASA